VIVSNAIQGNAIVVNGTPVWAINGINNAAEVVMSTNYDNNRDLIRDVILQGDRVGTLRLHANIQANGLFLSDNAGAEEVWLGGSTNSPKGWMIYDRSSAPLSSQTSWVGGVEDSRDADTNTNRKNTFHAATAFSEGDPVGAATQHGASPFLISMGDPLISRQSGNDIVDSTEYDAGQGKTIFTETDKSIYTTKPFDLDRDGQKDLLVIYTDGSVRILKNSGGKDPYKNLGMLMVIADGIKNVFIGDTDGNSYEDIMIQTNDDKLRVYKNDEGKMDVDGLQVCLAIPGGQENVKNAHEMFVEDMDHDGNIDIITNDTVGNIHVFYGGSSSAGDNYISKNKTDCDDQWQSRVDTNKKLVKSYGVTLMPGQKTYDNSLIHRQGLTIPAEPDANDDSVDSPLAAQSQFQNLVQGKDSNFSNLNVTSIINSGLPEILQYSASPISRLPAYEANVTTDTIAYVPIHLLDNTAPVTVYKEYSRKSSGVLTNGEKIDVKVTIQAKQASQFTFLDEIK